MDRTLRAVWEADAQNLDAACEASLALPAGAKSAYEREGIFGLGESYIEGEWDRPDLDAFMFQIFNSKEPSTQRKPWGKVAVMLLRNLLINPHSKRFAFNIAKRHYDLGNDLFQSMLDGTMTYTCGFWKDAHNLEQAQSAKLDLICKKLQLSSRSHVLDIGCGWGNFAKYAASRFGAKVTGVTVSSEQANYARESCNGLPVEILLSDYREVEGKFDHVVSIEMIEAVGKRNIPGFFDAISRALKPKGLALIQAICAETFSKCSDPAMDQFTLWIMKHIFPDGYLPNLSELTNPARKLFLLEDLHSFGESYDPTLMAWGENFDKNWPLISEQYGERFRRIWRFYLYSCAALFRARKAHVYQLLYSKP